MGAILEDLAKDLHLIRLPSTLWAVHLDPKYKFLVVLRLTFHFDKLHNEKAIIITNQNNVIDTSVYINNEPVEIPAVQREVCRIDQLQKLVTDLEEIKYCINSDKVMNCSKYILGSNNFCEFCALSDVPSTGDLLTAVEESEKYLENLTTEFNEVFLQEVETKEKKCLCTVCGKTFASNSIMQYHMLTHSKDKPFVCKICTKSFAKKYNLEVHVRIHSGERPYVCSKCGKTYSSRSNLSTHLNSFHRDIKQHRCDFCQMTFVHPRLVKIHMRKHTGEKPYKCALCQKQFAKNIHLTIHMRTHTGEKPHQCADCHKSFTTSGNLNTHIRINHKR